MRKKIINYLNILKFLIIFFFRLFRTNYPCKLSYEYIKVKNKFVKVKKKIEEVNIKTTPVCLKEDKNKIITPFKYKLINYNFKVTNNQKDYFFYENFVFHKKRYFFEKPSNVFRINKKLKFINLNNLSNYFKYSSILGHFNQINKPIKKNIKTYSKEIVHISTYKNNSYWHWMHLPGLFNISNLESRKKKLFYIGNINPIPKYIYKSLKLLNIKQKDIITKNCTSKKLIFNIQEYDKCGLSKEHCKFLKKEFKRRSFIIKKKTPELILIERKNVSRKITNFDEIYNFLKKFNFKKVDLAKLELKKQINIFHNAKFIVSPYGAAQSNLVFCEPKTKILEIFSYDNISNLFYALSSINNLQYGYVVGDKSNILDTNFKVNINKFVKIFKKMNTGKKYKT